MLTILGLISSGFKFLSALFGFGEKMVDRKDHIELGQLQQKTADQGQALKDAETVAKAQAGPKGPDVLDKELDDGKF